MIKFALMILLIRLLLSTNNVLLCAGIYAAVSFVIGLWWFPVEYAAVKAAISLGFGLVYFWLLDKFEESGFFWLILIPGVFCAIMGWV